LKGLAGEYKEPNRALIEACIAGDSAAQYKLYAHYSKAMFNIALRFMNHREGAEDVLQDSFIDAFARLADFRYESTFGAWLKRIVINHSLNELKRKKVELAFFDDMSPFQQEKQEEDDRYENRLSVDAVKKAMKKLPAGARIIFSLYLLEGYDHVEISQILNISESNSKSQYMRAKRKMKELISHEYETG
jgi:RNA polymerase sigma-70 factor (ECF subfamily)